LPLTIKLISHAKFVILLSSLTAGIVWIPIFKETLKANLMKTLISQILNYTNLSAGEDDKQVLDNVKSNISFKGSNLWILACAIVITSIGLNVNSTAVIMGRC
jgi:hypothetical protein